MGLGSAYRAGHAIGIARGYDVMIQIDADLSHDPAALPDLLAAVERGADLAIGSRYVPGGSVPNWPKRRLLLSVWGNRYAGFAFAHPAFVTRPRATARTARRSCAAMNIESTHSTGYAFQIEMTYRALRAGRPRRRGSDLVHRPRARHVEDVEPDRRGGDGTGDAVGDPGSRAAARPTGLNRASMVVSATMSRPDDRPIPAAAPADPAASNRFWIGLSAITAVALVWRVVYDIVERNRIALNGDAAYYHWQANLVAKGFGFIDPTRYELFGIITPSAGHPPAYIVYLAFVSRFIGTSVLTHELASTLLGAGAVFVLGVIARRLFASDWAGWIAALLAAGYAHLWINDEMLMSESMYVLTTAFAVWAAYRFWDKPRTRNAALMGAGIALAALSRAEAVSLFPFLAIPFGFLVTRRANAGISWRRGGGINWKRGLRYSLAACVAGGVLMAPWVVYNLTRFEHPVYLSNGVGSVLMAANCSRTIPAGQANAGEYVGTFHGPYVGYWSIYCTGGLEKELDRFYSPKKAAYYKAQLGDIPGTDINLFGDESTHEVAWRAVGMAEIKAHLREEPWMVVLRVARMWDVYRPRQNIQLNGLLEGRGVWQSRLATEEYFPLLAFSFGRPRAAPSPQGADPAVPRHRGDDHDHRRDELRHHALPRAGRRDAARLLAGGALGVGVRAGPRAGIRAPHGERIRRDVGAAGRAPQRPALREPGLSRLVLRREPARAGDRRGHRRRPGSPHRALRRAAHDLRTPAGPIPFIFTSNVATDPNARRKGLFREMAERIYVRAAATGAPGLAGTSNAISSVIIVERFGWHSLGPMPVKVCIPSALPARHPRHRGRQRVARRPRARRHRRGSRLGPGARLGAVVDARLPALAARQPRQLLRAARRRPTRWR